MEKHNYVLLVDRWIGTTFHKVGSTIRMTKRAAMYLELDGSVALEQPKEDADDAAPSGGSE